MIKPTASFKMSKQNKTFLAQLWNHPLRGQIRRSMIQAQLSGEIRPVRESRKK